MEWINVKEEMPRNYEIVLIAYYPKYLKGKGVCVPAKLEDGKFMDIKNEWFLNLNQKEIKYWQYLPKTPDSGLMLCSVVVSEAKYCDCTQPNKYVDGIWVKCKTCKRGIMD